MVLGPALFAEGELGAGKLTLENRCENRCEAAELGYRRPAHLEALNGIVPRLLGDSPFSRIRSYKSASGYGTVVVMAHQWKHACITLHRNTSAPVRARCKPSSQ